VEERLLEVERRYEEARDMSEAEARKAREESRIRKRAEARIGECGLQRDFCMVVVGESG
jgi:hypothetical protein